MLSRAMIPLRVELRVLQGRETDDRTGAQQQETQRGKALGEAVKGVRAFRVHTYLLLRVVNMSFQNQSRKPRTLKIQVNGSRTDHVYVTSRSERQNEQFAGIPSFSGNNESYRFMTAEQDGCCLATAENAVPSLIAELHRSQFRWCFPWSAWKGDPAS